MARVRVIDRNAVLDAAERVVSRDGAARLTLEAVAHEAGISKASVLYDYKTKQALIKTVVERRVERHRSRLRACIEKQGASPDAAMRGRIEATSQFICDNDPEVAFNLIAALASDTNLRSSINEAFRQEIEQILKTATRPRAAMLAFLALEGLKSMECLGLYTWPQNERERMLKEIENLLQWDAASTSDAASS